MCFGFELQKYQKVVVMFKEYMTLLLDLCTLLYWA